ncbi:MAG: ArnT family glycosyltransferase [Candidatus Binatia bacterium]
MIAEPPGPGSRAAIGACLLVMLLALAALRFHWIDEPFDFDVTLYAVLGHEMLAGKPLYTETWDHKPPAIYATFALAELVAGYGPHAVYLLNVLAAGASLLGVYAATLGLSRSRAASLWAAAVWTIVSGDPWLEANQPNAEVFMNAFTVWALVFALRLDRAGAQAAVAAGALLGLGSLYKTVLAVHALAFAAAHVAVVGIRGLGRALMIPGMVGAVWLVTFLYFAVGGRAVDFWEATVTYNRYYAGNVIANLAQLREPAKLFPASVAILVPLALLSAFGLGGGRESDRRGTASWIAYCLATGAAVFLPGRLYLHYQQLWFPPLIVGAGTAIAALGRRAAWLVGGAVLAYLAQHELSALRFSGEEISSRKYGTQLYSVSRRLGERLDRELAPGATFYNWGNQVGLCFFSGRRPAAGNIALWPMSHGPLAAKLTERTLADLERNRPEVIVVSKWHVQAGESHPVYRWIRERYRQGPGGDLGSFEILRPVAPGAR